MASLDNHEYLLEKFLLIGCLCSFDGIEILVFILYVLGTVYRYAIRSVSIILLPLIFVFLTKALYLLH